MTAYRLTWKSDRMPVPAFIYVRTLDEATRLIALSRTHANIAAVIVPDDFDGWSNAREEHAS